MNARCDTRPWGRRDGMPWACCLDHGHDGDHCWHASWNLSTEPHHWSVNGESILMAPHARRREAMA